MPNHRKPCCGPFLEICRLRKPLLDFFRVCIDYTAAGSPMFSSCSFHQWEVTGRAFRALHYANEARRTYRFEIILANFRSTLLRVEKRAKSLGSRCVLGGQIHYTGLLQGRKDTLDLLVASDIFSGKHTPSDNILATLDSTSLLRRPCDRSLQMVTELN